MKNLYKKTGNIICMLMLAAILLPTSSCNDALTTDSSIAIKEENVYDNISGLNNVLRAAYKNLLFGELTYGAQEAGAYVGIPGFNLYYDITSADIMSTLNYGMSPEDCYQFATARTDASRYADKIWRMMYLIINQANTVLDYVDDAVGGTPASINILSGQAKAMRGICYFHLIMNYQQTYAIAKNKRGVILRTSMINQPPELGFTTVEAVYTQIVKDLTEAKTHLENFNRSEKWEINTDVVSGHLARVYQVMQNWQGALTEADTLCNRYKTLMTQAEWCGGQSTIDADEIIWAVINNEQYNNGDNTQFCYWHNQDPSYGEGMQDGPIFNFLSLFVDQKYVDLFDDTDYRGTKCTKTWNDDDPESNHVTDADEKGVMFWHRTRSEAAWRNKWAYNKFKYYGDNRNGSKGQRNLADYSIMRSSEMLLIKAEAEANLNKPEALATLQILQSARNASLTTTTAKNELLEAIYVERRKELLGEGVTGMYDLVRLQKDLVRHGATAANPAGHFPWGLTNLDSTSDPNVKVMPSNDYRYFCQIPQLEFANNTAISLSDQNPPRGSGN